MVSSESVLFPGTGSAVTAETVAVLVTTPATVVVTTIPIVATPAEGIGPRAHVTTPASCTHAPWLGTAET